MSVPLLAPAPVAGPLPDWIITRERRLDDVAAFFRALGKADLVARFGIPGLSPAEWLLERLAREAGRGVLAARDRGLVVAVLDHTHSGCAIEFGIVVAAAHRRRGIGSALLAALLGHARRCDEPLIAHANRSNIAAVGYLIHNGFRVLGGPLDARLFVKATNDHEDAP